MLLNTCTLVTCYYKTPTRKHSFREYEEWMHNFLTSVESPLIVFCEEDSVDAIKQMRDDLPLHIVIFPFHKLSMSQTPYSQFWDRDYSRDPERNKNHPMLFSIWNEKTKFVQRAIEMNPFDTEFFSWVDIGCFRTKERLKDFASFPHGRRLREAHRGRLYVLQVHPFYEEDTCILPNGLTRSFHLEDRIGGTIMLGDRNAWNVWARVYYETLQMYMNADYFSGDDQDIMATIAIKHPQIVYVVTPKGCKGNPWFYMQEYFTFYK